mmetsp:Transcript_16118/g.17917  ORF Transcript_16118/g.17917 Transcript_16118/m.17917 type:complete len:577 (-) Transcript_16118:109-1839(-)
MKNFLILLSTLLLSFITTAIAALGVSEVEVEPSSFPLAAKKFLSENNTVTSSWSATSRVLIRIPENPDNHLHVSAAFGTGTHDTWRGTLGAFVKYVNDPLCQPLYITEMKQNKTIDVLPLSQADLHAPYWLMVERGNCSFVMKARMAQHMGAAGVIFADNKCLCSDETCQKANDTCQDSNPHVNDDGSGRDVSIPVLLLQKKSSDYIRDELTKKSPMYLEYRWGLPDKALMKDGALTHHDFSYDLWTTASPLDVPFFEEKTYKQLKTVTTKFADYLHFNPRYALIDGVKLGCGGKDVPERGFCQELCTNGGRYCSAAPGNGIKGQDVVIESLRRICIWNHYGVNEQTNKTDNPILWDYIIYHMQHCTLQDDGSNFYSNADCVADAFKHAKVDSALINECMVDSGGYKDNRLNTWLEEHVMMLDSDGIVSVPAIRINKMHVLSEPKPDVLIDVMCKLYFYAAHESMTMTDEEALKQVPPLCGKCYSCQNKIGCIENDGQCVDYEFHTRKDETKKSQEEPSHDKKKKKKGHFWFWFILVTFVLVGGGWFYKKNQDRFTSSNSGGLLNGYFQLNQGESS